MIIIFFVINVFTGFVMYDLKNINLSFKYNENNK